MKSTFKILNSLASPLTRSRPQAAATPAVATPGAHAPSMNAKRPPFTESYLSPGLAPTAAVSYDCASGSIVVANSEAGQRRKNAGCGQEFDVTQTSSQTARRRASFGKFLKWGRSGLHTPQAKT